MLGGSQCSPYPLIWISMESVTGINSTAIPMRCLPCKAYEVRYIKLCGE